MIKSRERIKQLKHSDVTWLREQLLAEQGGRCPICEKKVSSPCLDHHHIKRVKGSGLIRGVLCRSCNILLAKMENNCVRYGILKECLSEILRNMAQYLDKPHLPYKHPSEKPKPQKLKKISYNKLKKEVNGRQKIPEYPKSGNLTKPLGELFLKYNIEPEYYK